MSFALYTGCLIPSRFPFLEKTAKKVLESFNIEFEDFRDPICCFDPIVLKSLSVDTWLAIAARNLSIAEEMGMDILTLCNGCFSSLSEANYHLKKNERISEEVNKVLAEVGREYNGNVEVKHITTLLHDIGEEKIKEKVKSLSGFKVVTHHGCHLTRPSKALKTGNPKKPTMLDDLSKWVGADVVQYSNREMCCGSGLMGTDEKVSIAILSKVLKKMVDAKVKCIVTSCPFCFFQFDYKQKDVDIKYQLPILYISELYALALGLNEEEIGLNYHKVEVKPLI